MKTHLFSIIFNRIKGNIYSVLFLRIFLVYCLYSLMRVLFYLFNYFLFPKLDTGSLLFIMLGGLKFDTYAIIYSNIIVIAMHIIPSPWLYKHWYQQIIKWIFFIVNFLAIAANSADCIYFKYTLRRTTSTFFREFKNETNGFKLFFDFITDFPLAFFTGVALIIVLIWAYTKIEPATKPILEKKKIRYPISIALGIIIIFLCSIGIRGGIDKSLRPINLNNSFHYVNKPEHREIVLNTPFTLIRTLNKKAIEKKLYFNESELADIYPAIYTPFSDSSFFAFGKFKGRNVVIIILESFSKEFIGYFHKSSSFTPFLDSLGKQSYVFEKAFANGKKSIDAMPSILSSIPAMEISFVLSAYSGNAINSISSLLPYRSSFFHGAVNGSMGFKDFVKQAGYKDYFGRTEYRNDKDYDGTWGIWDEPFLQYMADRLNTYTQPFISTVFTLSSHHPYSVPDTYKNTFNKGEFPIHQCISYTDNALRLFFEKACKMPWFNNTIFVITADHAATQTQENNNSIDFFSIPIMFFAPNSDLYGYDDSTVVSQCDIMPTLLYLMGYEQDLVAFGQNMFSTKYPHFAVNYLSGAYRIVEKNLILHFYNDMAQGLYNYTIDPNFKNDLSIEMPHKKIELEKTIKAFIQQYNSRISDNKLKIQR